MRPTSGQGSKSGSPRDGDRTRREVLAGLGAAGMAGLAGCGGGSAESAGGGTATPTESKYANYPVGDTVTVGVSIPKSGIFGERGTELRAGYELAAKHLSEGGGFVGSEPFGALASGGIRGKPVDLVVEDTTSTTEGARSSVRRLLEQKGATVVTGGGAASEAMPQQAVASDHRAIYMAGFAPLNALNGSNCSPYGFNEMLNPTQISQALAFYVALQLGSERTFGQVFTRSPTSKELFTQMKKQLKQAAKWRQVSKTQTRVGAQDYDQAIEDVLAPDPDVIILNYTGLDGAFALSKARKVVGEDTGIVLPLLDRPLAANAADSLSGILGAMHWNADITKGPSKTFEQAWRDEYGDTERVPDRPSGLAHLAYVQLLQYANAVERAKSFKPPDVIAALEKYRYSVGLGTETMQHCDHHAQRPVPIVQGLPNAQQGNGKYFKLLNLSPEGSYGCDKKPASNCSF